jgi:hypothetical protein
MLRPPLGLGIPTGAVKTRLVAWPTKAVASSAAATALMNRLVRPLASPMVAERADCSAKCSTFNNCQQLKQVFVVGPRAHGRWRTGHGG